MVSRVSGMYVGDTNTAEEGQEGAAETLAFAVHVVPEDAPGNQRLDK